MKTRFICTYYLAGCKRVQKVFKNRKIAMAYNAKMWGQLEDWECMRLSPHQKLTTNSPKINDFIDYE